LAPQYGHWQHRLRIPPGEELFDELASVCLRKNSLGVYRLDHDARGHDDQAAVLALGVEFWLDADRLPNSPSSVRPRRRGRVKRTCSVSRCSRRWPVRLPGDA